MMASPGRSAGEKTVNESFYDRADHHVREHAPGSPDAAPAGYSEVLHTRVPLAVDSGDCGPDLTHLNPKQAQTLTCRSILMLFFGARASPPPPRAAARAPPAPF